MTSANGLSPKERFRYAIMRADKCEICGAGLLQATKTVLVGMDLVSGSVAIEQFKSYAVCDPCWTKYEKEVRDNVASYNAQHKPFSEIRLSVVVLTTETR